MYNRNIYKYVRGVIPETRVSTDSTSYNTALLNSSSLCSIAGFTTKPYGTNFECTIECTTGALYILPEAAVEPTSSNSYYLSEGEILDIRIKSKLGIKGNSTTAGFQAIIWGDG